jgi:putative addiction module component (TIGR02574 family)
MSDRMMALGLDGLSRDELYELVQEIWDELHKDEETRPLTATEEALIDARLESAEANPEAGSPWEEVKARLLGRSQ